MSGVDIATLIVPTPNKIKIGVTIVSNGLEAIVSKNPELVLLSYVIGEVQSKSIKKFFGDDYDTFVSVVEKMSPKNPVTIGKGKLEDIFKKDIQGIKKEFSLLMGNVDYAKLNQFTKNSFLARPFWGKHTNSGIGVQILYNKGTQNGIAKITHKETPGALEDVEIDFSFSGGGSFLSNNIKVINWSVD